MLKITYFVHGTTTDNLAHKATGWLPGTLSELGVKQSKELPNLIHDDSFTTVYCSDLDRAIESAKLSFKNRYPIVIDHRLREANYGDFNGGPHEFKNDMEQYVHTSFPGGESYIKVEDRLREFIKYVLKRHPDGHIAIVAHEAPQLALEVIVNGKTWHEAIETNWRKLKAWQPGWIYEIKSMPNATTRSKSTGKF